MFLNTSSEFWRNSGPEWLVPPQVAGVMGQKFFIFGGVGVDATDPAGGPVLLNDLYFCRVDLPQSRRRRGCDVDIPWRWVAAPPRLPRG